MKKIVIIFAFFLAGCSTTPELYQSNVSSNFNKEISEIGMVLFASKLGNEESQIEKHNFELIGGPFVNNDITVDLLLYLNSDLDNQKRLKDIMINNEFILVIDPVSRTTGDMQSVTYALSIIDRGSDQKIWASSLYMPWGQITSKYERFDEMGSMIFKRLIADGVIVAKSKTQD